MIIRPPSFSACRTFVEHLTGRDLVEWHRPAFHSLSALHPTFEVIEDGNGDSYLMAREGTNGGTEKIVPVRISRDPPHDPPAAGVRLPSWNGGRPTADHEIRGNEVHPCRNFLIIAPEPVNCYDDSDQPDGRVTALAHRLIGDGFVYVARSNQREMEDDPAGVRFLPLREKLPQFGTMTAVIAINEPLWAAFASDAYPEADIFLMEVACNCPRHSKDFILPESPAALNWQRA